MGQGAAAASEGKAPSVWDRHHAAGPDPATHAGTVMAAKVTKVPAAGDTRVALWLLLLGHRMANISYAGSPGLDIQAEPVCV